MKKIICLMLTLALISSAACALTREATVWMEGEPYTVTETLYTSGSGVTFWYDDQILKVSESETDGGTTLRVEPSEVSVGAYLEIKNSAAVGMLPWEYLAGFASEGTDYDYDRSDAGHDLVWFTNWAQDGMMYTYTIVEGETDFAAACAAYPAEAAEGWGERFSRIVNTLDFTEGLLSAYWAEDVSYVEFPYTEIVVSADPPVSRVALFVSAPVTDLRILSVELAGVGEDGIPVFTDETVRTWGDLTPGQILIVDMTFWGDIPNNGVSYIDANGVTHRYTLEISGENGSLILSKY